MFDAKTVSKAIASFLAVSLLAFLRSKGLTFTDEVSGAVGVLLDALVGGAVAYVIVYLAPKNKEVK